MANKYVTDEVRKQITQNRHERNRTSPAPKRPFRKKEKEAAV